MKLYFTIFFKLIFLLENLIASESEVGIKIINRTPQAIRVTLNSENYDEQEIVGIRKNPVYISSIPIFSKTIITFESIDDEKVPEPEVISGLEKANKVKTAVISTHELVKNYRHTKEVKKLVDMHKQLIDACESGGKVAEELAKSYHSAIAEAAKTDIEIVKGVGNAFAKGYGGVGETAVSGAAKSFDSAKGVFKNAGMNLGLGAANIGVNFVDWYFSKGQLRNSLIITPTKLPNYRSGKEIVIEINEDSAKVRVRNPPKARSSIKCLIESTSNYPLICAFKDPYDDLVFVRLHKEKFPMALIELPEYNPLVQVQEVIGYDKSYMHSCLGLVKGGLNTGLAIVDPFPITKLISAASATSEFWYATTNIADRFLANRQFSCKINRNGILKIYDRGMYELGFRIKTVNSLDEIDQQLSK